MQKHILIFFLGASFANKVFVFPNSRISEACICHQGWFRKTCTFACVISLKRKTQQKKRAMFFHYVQGDMKKIQLTWMQRKKPAQKVEKVGNAGTPSIIDRNT